MPTATDAIQAFYAGSYAVEKLYAGDTLVWSGATPPKFIAESAEAITNSATSFEHTLPPGIKNGDLIMTMWKTNETSSTKSVAAPPAGWVQDDLDRATFIWHKIAEGGEASVTANWTGGASGNPTVHSVVYRNVDTDNPFLKPPEVYASSSTSNTSITIPDSVPQTSAVVTNLTKADQLDNWTSFMEGTSYVGVVYATNTMTLDPATTRQPNLVERQQTVNGRDHRHFSHEGITENSGLYNGQRARWTHSSNSHNGGFHAILRAPRTADWLSKTHVAYRNTALSSNSYDATLVTATEVAHLDGMLALVMSQNGNNASVPKSFDLANPTNSWMTAVNGHTYYGEWITAGRSVRNVAESTRLNTTFIIANANMADPVSVSLERMVHSFHTTHNSRFWTRPNQLVLGSLRTSNYDAGLSTIVDGTAIEVDRQEYQINTSSGNQTAQTVEGRGTVAGFGTLPRIVAKVNWNGNENSWVGINHSSESTPALATPAILGTPTVQTKNGGSTITITKPSGCQVGEILVMFTHWQNGGEFLTTGEGPPAGFEPIECNVSGSAGGGEPELWMKVVDGTEPATWAPNVNGDGAVVMVRMTGILPNKGFQYARDTTTLQNPQPFPAAEIFKPGIFVRIGGYQDSTARVIDNSAGVDLMPDTDVPPLAGSTYHINMTGEVLADTTVPAATYTVTPFPGAPSLARAYVYHIDAAPAE